MTGSRPLVLLIRGDEPSLLRDAVRRAVDEALGDADRSLAVDEFAGEDYELASVVDAAQTPPFLTTHRVVVARDLQRFTADGLAPMLRYLAQPLDSTTLVLVWASGGGRLPKALTDALKAAGAETVSAAAPSGRARQQWVDEEIAASGLRLDHGARQLLGEQVGDDVARLPGILAALDSAFGSAGSGASRRPPGRGDADAEADAGRPARSSRRRGSAPSRLTANDIEPFLGDAGSVPPWELTDAIDRGDPAVALDKLHRVLGASGRHPLQVMVTLHSHFERILRLHGSGAATEQQAAEVLGLKGSTFPARKALSRVSALGPTRLARAVQLLAEADQGLRGAQGWPPEQVMEVLVVRLARLAR